jgi:hypothetical protein
MGSLALSLWQCLQCNRCHASISQSHLLLDMHHSQHTGSLLAGIQLLLHKDIPPSVTLHKVTPRVVHTLHLVTHHRVPTRHHRVPILHRVTMASKERTA